MRTYDTEGHIVGEYVRRGTQWVERPHTLTAEWAARPLRDFLPESGPVASLCSSCDPIVGTHTGAAYDSVVSSNESITLDGVVDTAGASLNVAASASSPNLEFMMYGGGAAEVLSLSVVDVYFMWPDDEYMQEVVFTGQDLVDAKAQFVYDTTGLGQGNLRASLVRHDPPSKFSDCQAQFLTVGSTMAKQCGGFLIGAAAGFLATGLIAAAGAALGASGPGGPLLAGYAYNMARGAAAGATSSLFGYLICKRAPGLLAPAALLQTRPVAPQAGSQSGMWRSRHVGLGNLHFEQRAI